MPGLKVRASALRLVVAGLALSVLGACSGAQVGRMVEPEPVAAIDIHRSTMAVSEAKAKRARGERVWCVPFARTMSGIELRGNAETWFAGAKGVYERGAEPEVGAVMVFSGTRKLPMGHVAVVSKIVSDREILIDHANWKRNQVSLGMSVIDVSAAGDWSVVQVAYDPGQYGRDYPISGFVYPRPIGETMMAEAAPAEAAVVTASTKGAH
jgi:hypothetical protein